MKKKNYFWVKFTDGRKKNKLIIAENKKEAIKKATKLFICGFAVYKSEFL